MWEADDRMAGDEAARQRLSCPQRCDDRRLDAADIEQDRIGIARRRIADVLGDAARRRRDADRIRCFRRFDPIDDAAGARLGEGIRIDIPADNVLEQAAGPGSEGERATDQARPDQEQGAHITSRKACSSRSFSSGRPIEARRWFGMP